VQQFAKGRVICVFGCGGDRDRAKRPIMGEIAGRFSELAVITSDNPRTEDPMAIIETIEEGVKRSGTKYAVIENRKEAIRYALSVAQGDDVIMIAGKGHENYQEIKGTKYHFDDKEIVEELLSEL
jgi:UDP-N-acetylmuramoyl-L-alanyl-D-glutamate--2,6-diaminopimelate ligase